MHMANEQYQQNNHKWKTWQLGFQTLERYWASFQVTRLFHSATIFFSTRPITRMKRFIYFYFYFYFFGGWGVGGECVGAGGGGGRGGRGGLGAQLQCIYYLVLYTDNKAAEGN